MDINPPSRCLLPISLFSLNVSHLFKLTSSTLDGDVFLFNPLTGGLKLSTKQNKTKTLTKSHLKYSKEDSR